MTKAGTDTDDRRAATIAAKLAVRLRWLVGPALLGWLVGVVALHFGELARMRTLFAQVAAKWLALAILLQGLKVACAPTLWHRVVGMEPDAPRWIHLLPLSLARVFADHVVPTGGVSGGVAVVTGLQRRGVSRALALAAILVDQLAYSIAYAAAVGLALALLAAQRPLPVFVIALALGFVAITAAIPAAILYLSSPRARPPPAWLRRFSWVTQILDRFAEAHPALLRHPRLLTLGALLRLAMFVLDAATLAVMLRAIGHPMDVAVAFTALIVGSLAATVAPVPGGIGTFEVGTVSVLVLLGVPAAEGLTATLLLRGLTFWLPIVPGYWAMRRFVAPT